jgi:formylglycine-generating enzyme required for sulfatase activity
MVSWENAVEFCRRLSELPKERAARRTYRLPTEAEWEYACRAGTISKWCSGDEEAVLEEYAWLKTNSDNVPHPVGQKKPNAFGVYDMHGNVWEWCLDCFSLEYYRQSPPVDPPGAREGVRVMRGGPFNVYPLSCRSAFRHAGAPAVRDGVTGFRVMLVRN